MAAHTPVHASTARALFRVFVLPATHHAPRPHFRTPLPSACLQVRHASPYRKVAPEERTTSFNDPTRPLDDKIRSRDGEVHFKDEDGMLRRNQSLSRLLDDLDRRNDDLQRDEKRPNLLHLRQIALENERTPIVKFTTARDLRAEDQAKLKSQKSGGEVATKQLELNWALDQKGDLLHRMEKLQDFLKDGKRVEVLFALKRGSRRVEMEEMTSLLAKVREAALQVPGAYEWREAEGQVGRVLALRFRLKDGTPVGTTQQPKSKDDEKRSRKEAEKEERKKRAEERQRQAMERKAELDRLRTVKVEDIQK